MFLHSNTNMYVHLQMLQVMVTALLKCTVDCTAAGHALNLLPPATNEPGISLLTAAYCTVPCFLVQSGLVGCLQIVV